MILNMHIYVCVCVYIYIYICIYTYICWFDFTCLYNTYICIYIYIVNILVWTPHKSVAEVCEGVAKLNKKCAYRSQASNTIPNTISTKLRSIISITTSINQFEICRPGARVDMSSWSSCIRQNVVLEQQDRSNCRPNAAGQNEMSS